MLSNVKLQAMSKIYQVQVSLFHQGFRQQLRVDNKTKIKMNTSRTHGESPNSKPFHLWFIIFEKKGY